MAAGLGTRMRSDVPKHLHPILGRRMVDWVLASSRGVGVGPTVVSAPGTSAIAGSSPDSPLVTIEAVPPASISTFHWTAVGVFCVVARQ